MPTLCSGGECRDDAELLFRTPGPYRNIPAAERSGERDLPPLSPTRKRMTCTDPLTVSPCTPVPSVNDFTPTKSSFGQIGLREKVDSVWS